MRQESGRSMIEMVGVLAIMGMLTATAFALISLGISRQKQSRVTDDVVTIVSGVRSLLVDYDDFSNIDNSTIFAAMSMSDKNPYGGTYELTVNPYNKRQFIVKINGLSKSKFSIKYIINSVYGNVWRRIVDSRMDCSNDMSGCGSRFDCGSNHNASHILALSSLQKDVAVGISQRT